MVLAHCVRNFRKLIKLIKHHIVNNVYTLPPKLSSLRKKFGSGLIFCVSHINSKHLEICFDASDCLQDLDEKSEKKRI